ncbi:MAG: hypothetical protein BJ554DRAFT_5191, partial [Olpidium bornovanus]
ARARPSRSAHARPRLSSPPRAVCGVRNRSAAGAGCGSGGRTRLCLAGKLHSPPPPPGTGGAGRRENLPPPARARPVFFAPSPGAQGPRKFVPSACRAARNGKGESRVCGVRSIILAFHLGNCAWSGGTPARRRFPSFRCRAFRPLSPARVQILRQMLFGREVTTCGRIPRPPCRAGKTPKNCVWRAKRRSRLFSACTAQGANWTTLPLFPGVFGASCARYRVLSGEFFFQFFFFFPGGFFLVFFSFRFRFWFFF